MLAVKAISEKPQKVLPKRDVFRSLGIIYLVRPLIFPKNQYLVPTDKHMKIFESKEGISFLESLVHVLNDPLSNTYMQLLVN